MTLLLATLNWWILGQISNIWHFWHVSMQKLKIWWQFKWFNMLRIGETFFSQYLVCWFGWFMVFNATFNNISVISRRSVLLVEETGVPGENQRPVASHWQTSSDNFVSSTPRHDFTGSCKSNYHESPSPFLIKGRKLIIFLK
jgi:hypothetical protein